MLKGFNYPLTPKGKSTLNPAPPWHYSADFLDIEFWSDPAAMAAVLPDGLDPDPSAKGHCNALFYDWQFSGENEEYLDPARYQYRKFFILVDALFNGNQKGIGTPPLTRGADLDVEDVEQMSTTVDDIIVSCGLESCERGSYNNLQRG